MKLQLDRQEEIQLFDRFHAGDLEAGAEIIEKNKGLVLAYVRKVTRSGAFSNLREDLIQSGIKGLIIARDRFESDRANGFGTYAYYWIRKYVEERINAEKKFYARHQSISTANTENEEEELSTSLDDTTFWSDLEKILTRSELDVCRLKYQGHTMTEIGRLRGVSRQRIHQLIESAWHKIQQHLNRN